MRQQSPLNVKESFANRSEINMAATASWIGAALTYYDFLLYGTAAALIFGSIFFPNSDPKLSTVIAMASISLGYLVRPIGAVFMGYVGDVYGRKLVFVLTLFLMGGATFAVGVLPTYSQIGISASLLLIAFRLIQGFALAGVQASAGTWMLELSQTNRRGLYTSFMLSGAQAGLLFASVAFIALSIFMPEADILEWGWRIPFLLSAALIAVGLWISRYLPESPVFVADRDSCGNRLNTPLKTLWGNQKIDVFRVILATQVTTASYIVVNFSLSWAVNHLHVSRQTMLAVLVTNATIGTIAIPGWAHLSDLIGKKPIFIFGGIASAVLIWPYFWALGRANIPLSFVFGALLSGIGYYAANSVWPSLYGGAFASKVRLSGLAIGTQIGFMIAAQTPTLAAYLMNYSSSEWIPAAIIVSISCVISALAVCFFPRRTY